MIALNIVELFGQDGFDTDVVTAARTCAQRLRDDVLQRQGTLFGRSDRTGLSSIRALAEAQGVRALEFAAPLASEGELVPLGTGGFLVRVARPSSTNRARFTLAHEIGHTFFYDSSTVPPRRLDDRPLRSLRTQTTLGLPDTEEVFCDEFASELLLPTEESRSALQSFSRATSACAFVQHLESTAVRQAVSVRMLLVRLKRLGLMPDGLVAVVLMVQPHFKTGYDETLRVVACYCADRRSFFPPNQRANTIGFAGALRLVSWWNEFGDRDTKRVYKRRSGVASFVEDPRSGSKCVAVNDEVSSVSVDETLLLWRKNPGGRWTHMSSRLPVTYRFYASNVAESYCLAVVDARSPQGE